MTNTPGGCLVIALLASLLASCGGSPSAPTDASNRGAPTMTLRGRIVDDIGAPVQGVTVTLNALVAKAGCESVTRMVKL